MFTESDDVILAETSPWGNMTAFVEDDGETVYFYLYGPDNVLPMGESPDDWSGVRHCWVCNRVPIADGKDLAPAIADMQAGRAPVVPAPYCARPATPLELDPNQLKVVWFESADSAALVYEGAVLAVIPPWACPSFGDVAGYAKECAQSGFIGLRPLEEVDALIKQRVDAAVDFWEFWSEPEMWKIYLNRRLETLEEHLGKHTEYFALDGERFPFRGVAVFEQDDKVIFITVGVSILAQPRVELSMDEPHQYRRIEMGIALDKAFVHKVGTERIALSIGVMASRPWDKLCWIRSGSTVDCDIVAHAEPFSLFDSALMCDGGLGIPEIEFADYRSDRITILWAVPISQSEKAFLRDNSLSELIHQLSQSGHSWVYKARRNTVMD